MSPTGAIRLGLIGVGRWGKNFVRTIATLDDIVLSVVASRNPQTAALVPAGCRLVAHWQDLIAADDLDGIIVASPPDSHAEILISAVAAGKPALIEKPLVASRQQAQAVRSALTRRSATVLVDHIHLFHPAFRALQREAGLRGPIVSIEASAGNHGPYRKDVPVLWDWGPHDLAMCLTLVPGPARALHAECLSHETIQGILAQRITLDLVLAGGLPARLRLSTLDSRHRRFAVTFEREILIYQDVAEAELARYPAGADLRKDAGTAIPVTKEPPLSRAVREFARAIRTGSKDRTSVDLALAIVELLADFDDLLRK